PSRRTTRSRAARPCGPGVSPPGRGSRRSRPTRPTARRRCGAARSRAAALRADEARLRQCGRLLRLGTFSETPAEALLEVRKVHDHDLARSLAVAPAHGLDDLFVRSLGRAPGLLIAHVADAGDNEPGVGLDGRVEHLVAGGAGELDVEIHARVRVRDRLPQQWARALDILLKSADGGRVGALGRELGGGGLDHLARLSEL